MPKVSRWSRRRWRCLSGVALAAGLVGCAGVPTSGSVHVGGALPSSVHNDPNSIKVIPAPPLPNLPPAAIVTGYLDALVNSDGNYSFARKFLAPGTPWNSTSTITLFDASSQIATPVGHNRVDVKLRRVGIVDSTGRYRVAPGQLTEPFELVKLDGQWRISKLPTGVLLSTSDARRSLQTATLYFFNPAQSRVVPEPTIVTPDQPGLATTLITRLLAGPGRTLGPAVRSAVPSGTALVGNVPTDSHGIAEVNLAGNVQQLTAAQLAHLSAEIVWTLRQVPGITAVDLLDDGAPLTVATVPRIQPITAWSEYAPNPVPVPVGALLSGRHQVVGLNRKVPAAFAGIAYRSPTLTADGGTAAALRATITGQTLYSGSALGQLLPRLSGAVLTPPAFDASGDVLVARSTQRRSTLLEVSGASGDLRRITVPATLRGLATTAIAVSPDGTRVALVVGPEKSQALMVGVLSSRHGSLAISGLSVLIPATADVRGVAWNGTGELVTTVRKSEQSRAVRVTSVDGYRQRDLPSAELPGNPTQVAATLGQPILAEVNGAIWSFTAGFWQRASTGKDPSYPG